MKVEKLQKRNATIIVPLTDREKADIQREARAARLAMGSFVRLRIFGVLGRESSQAVAEG